MLDEGTVWLSANAHETENISIPTAKEATHLCMQVLRPDGSLCYEKSVKLDGDTDLAQLLKDAKSNGDKKVYTLNSTLYTFLKMPMLRVGRPITIGLDYRRKGLWPSYLLEPTNVKTKKQKGGYVMACRWANPKDAQSFVDGNITVMLTKDGTATIDYTLTPSDSIGGHFLDYGLAFLLPKDFDQVAWTGQGPFSQTPDKTAYNNYGSWQLHRDDIRFYGNRADVGLMEFTSQTTKRPIDQTTSLALCSDNKDIHIENVGGQIVVTDNLVVGTYGTKAISPKGKDAAKIGTRSGHIILKADATEFLEDVFGPRHDVNPEHPYLESYGK